MKIRFLSHRFSHSVSSSQKQMEALRELERVQRMLFFMQSHGLSSGHSDSDRFFAQFLLFMVQSDGVLCVEKKCDLIALNLPKISGGILGDALLWVSEKDCAQSCADPCSQTYARNELDLALLEPEAQVEEVAKVGFDAIQRANSTLEDFCRSYFMFHEMDVNKPESIFKYLPVVAFTESYIYQLDIMNEKVSTLSSEDRISGNNNFTMEIFRTNPFDPLLNLLQSQGLLTDRIGNELKTGMEYWALERKLCGAFVTKNKISIEDVMKAIHLKSFDYRVLNLLLYQLRGEQVNDLHMEFLSVSEFLVELSDDLYDYEDDVLENSFNILRMFIRIYGASKAPSLLAKCISEAEEKYELLSRNLDFDLLSTYQKRCEEATKEGGKASGHALGTWNIPPVIVDEESYRLRATTQFGSKLRAG